MPRLSQPFRFLVAYIATLIVLAGPGVAAFNVVIDPLWRYDLVSIPGLNAQRQVAVQARLAKAQILCRLQPATVVMGTSRVEVGINPVHPALQDPAGPAYNLALAGSGIHELDVTLRHAVHASPRLKRVLLGIDFLMFNAHREAVVFGTEVLGYDENRLLVSKDGTCLRAFFNDFSALIGMRGYKYSIGSIRAQMLEPTLETADSLTSWLADYDQNGWRDHFAVIDKLFGEVKDETNIHQESAYVARIWRPAPVHRYCFSAAGQPNTFEVFRGMLEFARASGIDLKIFINPIHAWMLVAIREAGLWPTYEEWKRKLVATLAEEASAAGEAPFDLWDFSGFSRLTMEPPTRYGGGTSGFWEHSHYRSDVGDLMLDRMIGYRDPQRDVPEDFGTLLDADNIEAWTLTTRAGMRDYVQSEPDAVANLQRVVAEAMKDQGGSDCGNDLAALDEASAALERGDRGAAEEAIQRAIAIHEQDRREYAEIGAPYRETAFDGALAAVRGMLAAGAQPKE